jgi:hypothetical protein
MPSECVLCCSYCCVGPILPNGCEEPLEQNSVPPNVENGHLRALLLGSTYILCMARMQTAVINLTCGAGMQPNS